MHASIAFPLLQLNSQQSSLFRLGHDYAHLYISYPNNNCYAMYGTGSFVDPQTIFPDYLNHTSGVSLVQQYLNSTSIAQTYNRPFYMLEMNTASCGGFPGISDSFGAALWALDYGLQMAYGNFSGAMLHVGGQNVYYNVSDDLSIRLHCTRS